MANSLPTLIVQKLLWSFFFSFYIQYFVILITGKNKSIRKIIMGIKFPHLWWSIASRLVHSFVLAFNFKLFQVWTRLYHSHDTLFTISKNVQISCVTCIISTNYVLNNAPKAIPKTPYKWKKHCFWSFFRVSTVHL